MASCLTKFVTTDYEMVGKGRVVVNLSIGVDFAFFITQKCCAQHGARLLMPHGGAHYLA